MSYELESKNTFYAYKERAIQLEDLHLHCNTKLLLFDRRSEGYVVEELTLRHVNQEDKCIFIEWAEDKMKGKYLTHTRNYLDKWYLMEVA